MEANETTGNQKISSSELKGLESLVKENIASVENAIKASQDVISSAYARFIKTIVADPKYSFVFKPIESWSEKFTHKYFPGVKGKYLGTFKIVNESASDIAKTTHRTLHQLYLMRTRQIVSVKKDEYDYWANYLDGPSEKISWSANATMSCKCKFCKEAPKTIDEFCKKYDAGAAIKDLLYDCEDYSRRASNKSMRRSFNSLADRFRKTTEDIKTGLEQEAENASNNSE